MQLSCANLEGNQERVPLKISYDLRYPRIGINHHFGGENALPEKYANCEFHGTQCCLENTYQLANRRKKSSRESGCTKKHRPTQEKTNSIFLNSHLNYMTQAARFVNSSVCYDALTIQVMTRTCNCKVHTHKERIYRTKA